ncbi:MAG: hypothetical protein LBR33_11390, partial [Propionibacteriaceae bacterium]|nr:hypothetical protein [Propionibacteriaceae bacterium]
MTETPVATATRPAYEFDRRDGVLAGAVLVVAWLAIHWLIPTEVTVVATDHVSYVKRLPGLGATAAFALLIATALVYAHARGRRPTRGGIVGLALLILGARPFALFPATPASGLLALVEAVGLVTWTVFWAGDPIARRADA